MNKPDVLSDRCKGMRHRCRSVKCECLCHRIEIRQRWLLAHHGEYNDNGELIDESVGQLMGDIEQVRTEVAKGIFEEIENKYHFGEQWIQIPTGGDWQSLKSKHLKG